MTGEFDILVVDDEPGLADLYAAWLRENHTVRTAYSAEEALSEIDADVDMVFLDRRMPQQSGDEVLEQIRERGLDCQVAMVTAVSADFDVIEMAFDAYLTKPVSREDLVAVIERLGRRSAYDETIREYFSLVSRRAALEAEKQREDLEASPEYAELLTEIERLEEDLESLTDELDEKDFETFFSEF